MSIVQHMNWVFHDLAHLLIVKYRNSFDTSFGFRMKSSSFQKLIEINLLIKLE